MQLDPRFSIAGHRGKAWGVDICEITMRDDEILERQVTLKQVQDTILENEYLSYKLKEDFSNSEYAQFMVSILNLW